MSPQRASSLLHRGAGRRRAAASWAAIPLLLATFLVAVAFAAPASAAAPTTLTITSGSWFEMRRPATLSANLSSNGSPVPGKKITFTYDYPAGSLLTCTGTTNSSGNASCTISRVPNSGTWQTNIDAEFKGDSGYAASGLIEGIGQYNYLPEGGFVIGDSGSLAPILYSYGKPVTLYSPTWSDQNTLSGGPVSSLFHGFQTSDSEPSCGGDWKVYGANIDGPLPTSLPDQVVVAVASNIRTSIQTDGSGNQRTVVQGNIAHVVVVAPDQHYPLDPSAGLTGTVSTVLC
jgi:hypothetical protein